MSVKPLSAAFHILLALVFFAFAWFQRNDLDPEVYYHPSTLDSLLWLLFYLMIGLGFLWQLKKQLPGWYFVLGAGAALLAMIYAGPGLWENLFGEKDFSMTQVSMSGKDPRVELTREFFGGVIALVALGYQWFIGGKFTAKTLKR